MKVKRFEMLSVDEKKYLQQALRKLDRDARVVLAEITPPPNPQYHYHIKTILSLDTVEEVAERDLTKPLVPIVVCLCGSTRFKEEFEDLEKALTLAGQIVLTVCLFGHSESRYPDAEVKERLDELHKRKIDLADYVYVVNPGNYIGESTTSEIYYAIETKKYVKYLSNDDFERRESERWEDTKGHENGFSKPE